MTTPPTFCIETLTATLLHHPQILLLSSCKWLICLQCLAAARVHPGETNASWMMKGALHQLLANTAESKQLREQFVFKVGRHQCQRSRSHCGCCQVGFSTHSRSGGSGVAWLVVHQQSLDTVEPAVQAHVRLYGQHLHCGGNAQQHTTMIQGSCASCRLCQC